MKKTPTSSLGLLNIGPVSEQWLRQIGINSRADLEAMGAVEAFLRIRYYVGKFANANLLYSLHGAIVGKRWNTLSETTRARLRRDAELKP